MTEPLHELQYFNSAGTAQTVWCEYHLLGSRCFEPIGDKAQEVSIYIYMERISTRISGIAL